jgi:hypothetical protein
VRSKAPKPELLKKSQSSDARGARAVDLAQVSLSVWSSGEKEFVAVKKEEARSSEAP